MGFIEQLYSMVNDEANHEAVRFTSNGKSFEIRDREKLVDLLSRYFKHRRVESLYRQLNNYGFRSVRKFLLFFPWLETI